MYHLLKELKELEGSRVDKIYNIGKGEIFIQVHKPNIGKKILRIILGKTLFLTEKKSSDDKPSHFCMLLRKKLEGKTLDSLIQLKPERIIQIDFKSKSEIKKLYLESFAKGNVILCDNDGIIIDSLLHQKFKDRSILPKSKYQHPIMKYNIFSLNKDVIDLFKHSKKDKMVTSLAIELGLGGTYAEEVCLLSKIDKNKNPKNINEKEIIAILKSIENIINNKIDSKIIYKDKKAIDVVSFNLDFYKEYTKKSFTSFSEALDFYYSNELSLIKKKQSPYTKQIEELKRIIQEQEDTLKSMKIKEEDNRKKAELIYNNYQLVHEIIDEINKANKKFSWEDIKKKLKNHKFVKDIDLKEKMIVVDV